MTSVIHLDKYAHFKSKYEMDAEANKHIGAHWNELNKTDRAVLNIIRQHSVGQCAAKLLVKTIAQKVGKSEVTIRRALSKLVRLKIIDRISTFRRVSVGQGASIFAIRPFVEQQNDIPEMIYPEVVEELTESKAETAQNDKEPLSFKTYLNQDLNKTLPLTLAPSFDNLSLYSKFKTLINATIGDKSITRKLYSTYMERTHIYRTNPLLSDIRGTIEIRAIQALKITIQATKTKRIDNLAAYYRGVLGNLIMPVIAEYIDAIHAQQAPSLMYVNDEGERVWL